MNRSIVQQVEEWYQRNSPLLSTGSTTLEIRAADSADAQKGKIEIRIETPSTAGSVTFWNDGNVCAIATKKDSLRELTFDDRPISADEDLAALLDSYFRQIQAT